MSDDGLDALSSEQLHDLAVSRAKRHFDVKFFWRLLQETPAADAATGDAVQAEEQTEHWSRQVMEQFDDDDARVEAQRPIYIDYLLQHNA